MQLAPRSQIITEYARESMNDRVINICFQLLLSVKIVDGRFVEQYVRIRIRMCVGYVLDIMVMEQKVVLMRCR